MADGTLDEARKRSVDNLQRLYTVVISLAVTESLRRLLIGLYDNTGLPGLIDWLMFVSLLTTVVPFYHGANRYLDATYVTKERSAKPQALMIDFVLLFIEGLAFFALAMLMNRNAAFYTVLACLLVLDAIWVGITNLTATTTADRFPGYTVWASINLLAATALLVFTWSNILNWSFWPTELIRNVASTVVVVARTVYDYVKVWSFYYPTGMIPAPAPAPVPHEAV